MMTLQRTFLIRFFVLYFLVVVDDCSKSCERLFYTGYDLRPLHGTWYKTLESGVANPPSYCAGIEVGVLNLRSLKIKILDMRINSDLGVNLSGRLQLGGKLEVATKWFTLITYDVLFIHKDYFCTYVCGVGKRDDYVQCATREPDVSINLMNAIFNRLHLIGIKIKRRNFQKIENSICF